MRNLPWLTLIPVVRAFGAHGAVIRFCENALRNDPRHVGLNLALGRSLLARGLRRSAEAAFTTVTEFQPDDVDALRTLGRLHWDARAFDRSLECWEKILKISPRDQEAGRMRKNLAAEGAIRTGGFETARSARDLARSQDQLDEIERSQKLVQDRTDSDRAVTAAREAAAAAPSDPKVLARLGHALAQKREYDEAIEIFEKVRDLCPDDFDAAARVGDMRILRFETAIEEAGRAAAGGEEGAGDRLNRLRREKASFEIEEFRRRVRAHPTDLGLRFQLGRILAADGRTDEAIEQFQMTVKDPKRKVDSQAFLGDAFTRKGLFDLAVRQYTQALEGIAAGSDRSKALVYALANTYEQMGDRAAALREFTRIFEVDIGYRDVKEKIEALTGAS